jgi:hypothetical protein
MMNNAQAYIVSVHGHVDSIKYIYYTALRHTKTYTKEVVSIYLSVSFIPEITTWMLMQFDVEVYPTIGHINLILASTGQM